jgi:hypothetical protein
MLAWLGFHINSKSKTPYPEFSTRNASIGFIIIEQRIDTNKERSKRIFVVFGLGLVASNDKSIGFSMIWGLKNLFPRGDT